MLEELRRRLARDGAVTVALRVHPGARRSALESDGEGLVASVAAPAEGGRANAALLRLLADAFGVPRRCVDLRSGLASRRKRVRIVRP